MFQAARPPVRWSRVDSWRAKVKGWAWYTELVKARPRCSVTVARAGSNSIGSLTGTCMASRSAVSGPPLYTS